MTQTASSSPDPPSKEESRFIKSQTQIAEFQLAELLKQSEFVGGLPSKLLPFIPEVPRGRTDVGKQQNPRFAELTQMLAQMDRQPPPAVELPVAPPPPPRLRPPLSIGFDRGGDGGQGGGGGGQGSGGGCFACGTQIKMANGEIVSVEEISVGDDTLGGLVTGTMILQSEQMYDYKEIWVSDSQSVLEDNRWIHVKDSPLAVKNDLRCLLYHFNCEHHLIYVGDVVFADYSYYPVGA